MKSEKAHQQNFCNFELYKLTNSRNICKERLKFKIRLEWSRVATVQADRSDERVFLEQDTVAKKIKNNLVVSVSK